MKTERVDDIPLLIAELSKGNLGELLSEHFPNHGNWTGIDGGKVTMIYLTYILSCADHRTSHVEKWVEERLYTLRCCMDLPNLTSKDLTDDRLGILLDKYADDDQWNGFEAAYNQELIQVYDLDFNNQAIRLDAMVTQSHRTASGDFQLGYSKQHRADLPQLKTMLAIIDPFAIPLVSLTVSGDQADDVLYSPLIQQLDETLPLKNQLFVGDTKMSSHSIRADIAARDHYYLTPLSKKQCTEAQIVAYLAERPKDEELIVSQTKNKKGEVITKAKAFEKTEKIFHSDQTKPWQERRIIVFSPTYFKNRKKSFNTHLKEAQTQLDTLNQAKQGRKKLRTQLEAEQAVAKILKKRQMTKFIDVEIIEETTSKQVRQHLNRPPETRSSTVYKVKCKVNELAQKEYFDRIGWRVFGSNTPIEKLSTLDAIQCYRNEYQIEHKFDELLNRITALMPVYLKKASRIRALIRLLLLALKHVSLIQMQVRKELESTNQSLKELYPGNPGRKTDKPTTKMLLKAFEYITLVIMPVGEQLIIKLTDLKPVQFEILKLLNLKPETYLKLNQISFSTNDLGET